MSVAQARNRDAADDGLNPSSCFSRAEFRGFFAIVGETFCVALAAREPLCRPLPIAVS
jgi:hypothetical protein